MQILFDYKLVLDDTWFVINKQQQQQLVPLLMLISSRFSDLRIKANINGISKKNQL